MAGGEHGEDSAGVTRSVIRRSETTRDLRARSSELSGGLVGGVPPGHRPSSAGGREATQKPTGGSSAVSLRARARRSLVRSPRAGTPALFGTSAFLAPARPVRPVRPSVLSARDLRHLRRGAGPGGEAGGPYVGSLAALAAPAPGSANFSGCFAGDAVGHGQTGPATGRTGRAGARKADVPGVPWPADLTAHGSLFFFFFFFFFLKKILLSCLTTPGEEGPMCRRVPADEPTRRPPSSELGITSSFHSSE